MSHRAIFPILVLCAGATFLHAQAIIEFGTLTGRAGAAAGGALQPGQSTVGSYLSSCAFAARRPSAARVVALLILGGLPLKETAPLGASQSGVRA